MSALPSAPPIDFAQFEEITRDWNVRAELIDGEIHVLPAPSFRHQAIVRNLMHALDGWVLGQPDRGMVFFSPIDVLLSEDALVQPDLAWWRTGPDLDELPAPPPDLAVEVLSPGTRRRDIGPKRAAYERAGVAELWFADPTDRTLTVLRRSGAGGYDLVQRHEDAESVQTPLMPGLDAAVGALFPA